MTTTTAPLAAAPPPNLGNVITTADVSSKGTGSYKADYVNWCRVTQLLREHAPGWQFHLELTQDGSHIWGAPDGTGYVVGYFQGPEGQQTPLFPQAVMDNRNNPVPQKQISARDVTDTHRRCLCTAAAATFGLAWQLWAREPVEDPHREPEQIDRDQLQRDVLSRLMDLGLDNRAVGIVVKRAAKGDPTVKALGQLPDATLLQLRDGKITPEKVQEWNDEAARASAEEADTPLAWTATESAPAATTSRRKAAAA